jgi:hypothetical protein
LVKEDGRSEDRAIGGLEGLDRVRDKINGRLLKKDGIKEYTLDADATEIIGEKADALFTYNGNKGYMPMLGFLYETPLCIYDEFREGNVALAFGRRGFIFSVNSGCQRAKRLAIIEGTVLRIKRVFSIN